MRRQTTNYTAMPALLLMALAGCRHDAGTGIKNQRPQVLVTTATAFTRQVPLSFDETGSFVADESSNIAPPVAGRIVSTPVDIGSFVRRGQAIAELDHRDAMLRLQQMQAQMAEATAAVQQMQSRIGLTTNNFDPGKVPEVAAARANYESAQAQAQMSEANSKRYENLISTGDVSQSALEQAQTQQKTAEAQVNASRQQYEAALNAARQNNHAIAGSQASFAGVSAQLAQAEKAVADSTIRAPFDGFITARPIAVGEYVALADKIATIVRIASLKLQMQTAEKDASRAQVGLTVIANVAAYPGKDFVGRISVVNPTIDPNSRAFILEARFDNPDAQLKPGMFATVHVLLPGGEQAVFVPRSAIVHDNTTDTDQAWVVANGKAQLHVVMTGPSDGTSTRILSGLGGNETVATDNQAQLYDGAPVLSRVVAQP